MDNLILQHPRFPNLRACRTLYDHVAWSSTHTGRDLVLMVEIEKYLGDSDYLMQRHLKEFTSMPDWIKRDAQLWVDGINKDSQFAYGIRAMLENNVLSPKIIDNSDRDCSDGICVDENDFLKYTYSNKYGKNIVEEFEILKKDSNGIFVSVQKTSSEKRETIQFYLDKNLKTPTKQNCCNVDQFIFKLPIEPGMKLNDTYHVVGKTFFFIDKIQREGWVVQSSDESDVLVIDKQTGLLLSEQNTKDDIVTFWEEIELIETNVFQKSVGIQLEDMKIPNWWKTSTMWFLEGKFTELEYLQAMEYLIDKKILRV